MRAGAALSALGHAAVIALAAWALPWLRVRPEPPPPVIAVSFASEADLAELSRRAAAPKAPPPLAPTPVPEATPDPAPRVLGPRFVAPEESEPAEPVPPSPEDFTLAPSFDAAAPLGFPGPAGTPLPEAALPPADPSAEPSAEAEAAAEPAPDLAVLRERHMRALSTAILRARVYPPAARGRGLMGTARLYLDVARDGGLTEVGLMTSSGSASLDRAAVAAAHRARFPPAPDDLPGASFVFLQDLAFEAR